MLHIMFSEKPTEILTHCFYLPQGGHVTAAICLILSKITRKFMNRL